jgi:UDP-N-acetylglucosamine--N-acetylmuramyl-(pentapeptide) pyrophosphoryl-undecaprenol N-acetylglucosamine transferase
LVLTAGSFVSVPVVWAAKILAIPVIVEQLDYRAGLANRLMAPIAKQILVTFAKSCQDYGRKAMWLGAPINPKLLQPSESSKFNWPWLVTDKRPLVLIVGGGTGAAAINNLVSQQLTALTKIVNIIHLTGQGKSGAVAQEHYWPIEFFKQSQMIAAYSMADLVVARAGLGTLIELAALKKPSIIVPIPNSQQVDNARAVAQAGAAIIIQESELGHGGLAEAVGQLLGNFQKQSELVSNWPQAIKIADEAEVVKIFAQYL